MDLDIQVQKLKMLKSNFLSEKYGLEDKVIKFYPQQIAYLKSRMEGLTKDVETAKLHPKPIDEQPLGMMVSGVSYSEKAEAGQAIINACKSMNSPDAIPLGEYRGFQMELYFDTVQRNYVAVMLGTGLRVGEVTGLRWCDIDLEDGIIDVNHTLVYYDHRTSEGKKGCYFNVNTPKTEAGNRQVPMLDFVKEAFVMEKERQELLGVHCEATIDGYTDFIFLNRFGQPQHQSTLNKAIRRIIRDCNDEQFLKTENPEVLLPHFSCHSLRHTFTTRMCEAGVNIKVIQDTLGHKDITTTLNIYTDVTKELKRTEFDGLDKYFNNSIA